MSARWLFLGYLALIVAPLALAHSFGFPPRSFWDELASGLGLTALAVLLVEFVLSGRFRMISGQVGMDVTMRLHQLLARTAAVFILLHPFLYRTPIMNYPRPDDVTERLTLGLTGASALSGILAWVLALVLIFLAIFRSQLDYTYETWRRMHGLGALLVAVLSVHHAIRAGRYSDEPFLVGFWLAMLAVAIGSLAWVYVVRPSQQLRNPYVVRSVRNVALKTWELVISPIGRHRLDYSAGQFVWLNVGHSPFSLAENPFSISSAPAQGNEVAFVIKELGDFTSRIGAIAPGTAAYIDGPHGNLTLDGRQGKGIALLAGGVGIAPLLGVLRQLAADEDHRSIILVYGNRVAEQIAYRDELEGLTRRLDLTVEHVLGEPPAHWSGRVGQLDETLVREIFAFDGASEWLYLLCGPPQMLEGAEAALLALGVPPRQVASERFSYD